MYYLDLLCLPIFSISHSRFPTTSNVIHPFLAHLLYQVCTLIHQLRERFLSGVLFRVFEVRIHYKLVDIDSCHTKLNAFLHDIWWKAVCAVEDDLDLSLGLLLYLL